VSVSHDTQTPPPCKIHTVKYVYICRILQGGGARVESRPKLWSYKYSLPGDPVPPVTLHVIHVATGRNVTVKTRHLFGDEHDAEGCPVSQVSHSARCMNVRHACILLNQPDGLSTEHVQDMAWWSEDSSRVRFIAGTRGRSKFVLCEADAFTGTSCQTYLRRPVHSGAPAARPRDDHCSIWQVNAARCLRNRVTIASSGCLARAATRTAVPTRSFLHAAMCVEHAAQLQCATTAQCHSTWNED
jgi:hypothetical protein